MIPGGWYGSIILFHIIDSIMTHYPLYGGNLKFQMIANNNFNDINSKQQRIIFLGNHLGQSSLANSLEINL